MRVAVLADIHGNLPALEAVLREVDAAGAEAVMPFDRLAGGRRVINPGSVGMPYGPPTTLAYWALLGPDVTLRRTPYDLDKAAERLRTSAWPGTAGFVEENVLHGPPSDTDALEIFSDWARQRRSH